jgi:hypothetical protein
MFANLSISNDPSFLKSVLRRGIAQFELGHYAEATVDLRSVLKVDPKHLKSIQFMRQITGPELNSEAMRSAYLRHYFRRLMITLISAPDRLVENTPWFNQCMLRVTINLIIGLRVIISFLRILHVPLNTFGAMEVSFVKATKFLAISFVRGLSVSISTVQ